MLSKKLKGLRIEKGLTQAELAAKLGVTQQAVAKWEAGRAFPEPKMILRIAELFSVSADFLLGGAAAQRVKIIGTVKAGYNALALEEDLGAAEAEVEDAERYRFLVVKGDSMAPYIRKGDLALVRLQPELKNGDIGVFINGEGEATVKQYFYENGRVSLVPFNSEYPTLTFKGGGLEGLTVFGRVVETRSKW
ncbi:MAG: LexA family protein [Christensenellales bacterium]|nr:XRE family transcriptional regulator [Eubacteriales bacterium]